MVRSNRSTPIALLVSVTAAAAAMAPEAGAAADDAALASEVRALLDRHFHDPDRLERLDGVPDNPGAMLDALDASHTARYTPDETAYYELLDIYAPAIEDDVERLFGPEGVSYVGLEMVTQRIDGREFIAEIRAGGPADEAGLRVGDEVLEADGRPFHPVRSFEGRAGKPVTLTIRRRGDDERRDEEDIRPVMRQVTPRVIHPQRSLLRAMRDSVKVLESGGHSVGYVRVYSYAGREAHETLGKLLTIGPLRDADALILDLRGGWGGASPEYALSFVDRAPKLTLIDRDGEEHVIRNEDTAPSWQWDRPLAVLIDHGSRSGKEVLAHVFRAEGVPLIGTRTAGAVLGGRPFVLSDDSLRLIAVMDVRVDGVRLESRGVEPTKEVPFDPRYADGDDPPFDAAIQQITESIDAP